MIKTWYLLIFVTKNRQKLHNYDQIIERWHLWRQKTSDNLRSMKRNHRNHWRESGCSVKHKKMRCSTLLKNICHLHHKYEGYFEDMMDIFSCILPIVLTQFTEWTNHLKSQEANHKPGKSCQVQMSDWHTPKLDFDLTWHKAFVRNLVFIFVTFWL